MTGAGRGIGREIALTLARAGADIVVAEIELDIGAACVDEIRALGREALLIETDVRQPPSVEAMSRQVVAKFGKIDILVNNAGIARNTPAEDTPDEEWLQIMDINLNGVFWCCRAVGRQMLEHGSGVIVNIASMSGSVVNKPQPQAAYNASKAGVVMLTKSLAAEWAERGLRANCISPGYIGTEMTKRGMSNEEWKRTWLEMTPMGRVGEPADVAHAAWYLASDAARYVTGTNLVVDGGYTCW
ncbi:MAG: SDR family oxidoreductase [Abitibacteriaceae bacterium]|nr:SDR family oxidoreductase [Abditibacteriaceae bacterium]